MPVYDRKCPNCGHEEIDRFERLSAPDPACPACETAMRRAFLTHTSASVAPDGIPGGYIVKHGICNPDGSPRRYDSHSEMRRAARDFGVENTVRHQPLPGTDKSPHTSRWVGAPVISEEERVRRWWEHEREQGFAPMKPKTALSGLSLPATGRDRVSEIIAESIQKAESSGFHDAQ